MGETTHPTACDKGMGKQEGKETLPGAMLAVGKGVSPVPVPHPPPTALCVLLKVPDLTTILFMVLFEHPPLRVLYTGTKDETSPILVIAVVR